MCKCGELRNYVQYYPDWFIGLMECFIGSASVILYFKTHVH
jgi:site-specific DNA-adenine methylase